MNTTKIKYILNGKKQWNPGIRVTYIESMTWKNAPQYSVPEQNDTSKLKLQRNDTRQNL